MRCQNNIRNIHAQYAYKLSVHHFYVVRKANGLRKRADIPYVSLNLFSKEQATNPLFCNICISYCLSDRGMSSFWAPHQAGFSGDTPLSGSSKGFESPRKKCKSGTAKSHSGLEVQASFINLLQRLSIALTAKLAKHNSKLTNHTLNESKVVYNPILYQRRSIPIELHSPIARRLAYFYTSHL